MLGYNVAVASNGGEARQVRSRCAPDLILMGREMPETTGGQQCLNYRPMM
jgi:CheY-like chemotaxis protein